MSGRTNSKNTPSRRDIYIHSKVILIDHAFGMLGSANHNERSMVHDSEDMLAFRSSERYDLVGEMQKELMAIALSGDLPETFDGKIIFKHFAEHLDFNSDNPNNPKSLVHRLVPRPGFGSVVVG